MPLGNYLDSNRKFAVILQIIAALCIGNNLAVSIISPNGNFAFYDE
jgi:hypothetical protein